MDIGKSKRTYYVEPLENPVPKEKPAQEEQSTAPRKTELAPAK
jgi:hypothetical protein